MRSRRGLPRSGSAMSSRAAGRAESAPTVGKGEPGVAAQAAVPAQRVVRVAGESSSSGRSAPASVPTSSCPKKPQPISS